MLLSFRNPRVDARCVQQPSPKPVSLLLLFLLLSRLCCSGCCCSEKDVVVAVVFVIVAVVVLVALVGDIVVHCLGLPHVCCGGSVRLLMVTSRVLQRHPRCVNEIGPGMPHAYVFRYLSCMRSPVFVLVVLW